MRAYAFLPLVAASTLAAQQMPGAPDWNLSGPRYPRVTVSVDSGPMHLAAAVGRPLIGIHAWTDPRKVGPYRADAVVWKGGKMCRFDELAQQASDFFSHRHLPCPDEVAAIAKRALSLAGLS